MPGHAPVGEGLAADELLPRRHLPLAAAPAELRAGVAPGHLIENKRLFIKCCFFVSFLLLYLALECDAAPGLGDDLAVLRDDLHLGADWKKKNEAN